MPKIRLLVAEDETVVRMALARLLAAEPDIEVVAEAADGEIAADRARRLKPDVVLMDLSMPRMDGIAATRAITGELPDCKVVVLTIHNDDEHLFGAIKAGARGYVLKEAPAEQMVEAIRAAARDEAFMDPSLLVRIIDDVRKRAERAATAKKVLSELTRRQVDVLALVGEGLRNKDIAERLFLSEKTVKNHISSIFGKLEVTNRIDAALIAIDLGLTERG